MATANLKNLFGGGGGSLTLKAGQSFSSQYGVGGVTSASISVSTPTAIINLTGRWAIVFIQVGCSNPGAGTMTATMSVDGVSVLSSASIGTQAAIPLYGMALNIVSTNLGSGQSPYIICNTGFSLTLQRSTADTVTVNYIALAID